MIVATTPRKEDREVIQIALNNDCAVYVGDENNVARRIVEAAELYGVDVIVRITHDCPLIDPDIIDATIRLVTEEGYDFGGNRFNPLAYPDGLDVDVFKTEVFKRIWSLPWVIDYYPPEHIVQPLTDAEWVTKKQLPYIKHSDEVLRWTLDTIEDYEWIRAIYDYYQDKPFGFEDIMHDFIEWKAITVRRINANNP